MKDWEENDIYLVMIGKYKDCLVVQSTSSTAPPSSNEEIIKALRKIQDTYLASSYQ